MLLFLFRRRLSTNGRAFPTSPSLKVKSEPYIALMLGSGKPAAAAVRLGDVAHMLQPYLKSYLRRTRLPRPCGNILLSEVPLYYNTQILFPYITTIVFDIPLDIPQNEFPIQLKYFSNQYFLMLGKFPP